MKINASHLVLQVAFMTTLSLAAVSIACGSPEVESDTVVTSSTSAALNVVVPPCIPYPGSNIDPCERRDTWDIGVSGSYRASTLPDRPFDTYRLLKQKSARCPNGFCTPQFYVRATVIPGSARCARSETRFIEDDEGNIGELYVFNEYDQYPDWDCFVDIDIHEYFNGAGPKRMPIKLRTIFLDRSKTSPELIDRYARGASSDYEGYEFIIPLVRDVNLALGEWNLYPEGVWDVQRSEDGEVDVVSWWNTVAPPEWWSDYVMSLTDFREMTREGMARFYRETGGRLGTSGQNPLAATDAGRDGLLGMLRELGAFSIADVTPVSAPPAPGEGDPYTPGQNIGDPTVTASPEVPGGLEDTATPVSALGDEPTATATAEPTATATVEPTVTPEPVPTPEPEDTPTPEAEAVPTATPEPVPTPEPEPTATATPEPVVDPTSTPEPVVEPTATATPETEIEPTATATPEPVIEPTATPEDAVATDTPEPEVPGPQGPGEVVPPGGEGPGTGGPDGPDTGAGPDG